MKCLWPVVLACVWTAGCGEVVEEAAVESWTCPTDVEDPDAFAVRVVSVEVGNGAGFGSEEAVLGPPRGLGAASGGLDVLTLGDAGSIVVELGADAVDCEGPDFIVFENPFLAGTLAYTELGEVSVSADGRDWTPFVCDPDSAHPHDGCAGVDYVYSGVESVDARDPTVAGGDAFDLADIGVERIRFVRIVDVERTNGLRAPPSRGFDLDAVGIVRGHALAR